VALISLSILRQKLGEIAGSGCIGKETGP
jgi:hypothetical protein